MYAACLGLCVERDITCPLPEILSASSCPNLDNRILTLTEDNKLTFVGTLQSDTESFVIREVSSWIILLDWVIDCEI